MDSGDDETQAESGALDPATVGELLEARRAGIVAFLFTEQHASSPVVDELFKLYAATLRDAAALELPAEMEVVKLVEEGRTAHLAALALERAKLDELRRAVRTSAVAGERLLEAQGPMLEALAGELQRLDANDPRLAQAEEDLRESMLHFRRGLEIVHRMFSRAAERHAMPPSELAVMLVDELAIPKSPRDIAALGQFARELSQAYHQVRDANDRLLEEARQRADALRQALLASAHNVLGAIDGVDSGLASLPETRARLDAIAAGAPLRELVADWLGVYERLDAHVTQFLAHCGLEAHTAPRGAAFDPETMDSQGTVADDTLPDGAVAAVVRRGFSLGGVPLRPIVVDLVKNG